MDVTILTEQFNAVRQQTENLCAPLVIEDYVIQSSEEVSPPKWHLAHTTWFFETFILKKFKANYSIFNPLFSHLFNSYYHSLGAAFPRHHRGLLSRPTVETIYSYRKKINTDLLELLQQNNSIELQKLIILGLHHEQQHQELLLMDIKYNFWQDPSFPIYHKKNNESSQNITPPLYWLDMEEAIVNIGHPNEDFCFDNELPRHKQLVHPFSIANRLITNEEYLEFIEAKGYEKPLYWLVDGWEMIQKNRISAPLYWHQDHSRWYTFTLNGLKKIKMSEPVMHVSFYEADAFARFKEARLPTEAEWEHTVSFYHLQPHRNYFLEESEFHSIALKNSEELQFLGNVWEWTSSAYSPYPGFKPVTGALGEYNGKFMSNQMVLRGGSSITPFSHIRASYRNFFAPDKRWPFCGIRLTKSKVTHG